MKTDTLTPVLTDNWDQERAWTLAAYEDRGGYGALKKALGMQPDVIFFLTDGQIRVIRRWIERGALNNEGGRVNLRLLCATGLVLLMIMVGGVTRLTASGLSIVEWALTYALTALSMSPQYVMFFMYLKPP